MYKFQLQACSQFGSKVFFFCSYSGNNYIFSETSCPNYCRDRHIVTSVSCCTRISMSLLACSSIFRRNGLMQSSQVPAILKASNNYKNISTSISPSPLSKSVDTPLCLNIDTSSRDTVFTDVSYFKYNMYHHLKSQKHIWWCKTFLHQESTLEIKFFI